MEIRENLRKKSTVAKLNGTDIRALEESLRIAKAVEARTTDPKLRDRAIDLVKALAAFGTPAELVLVAPPEDQQQSLPLDPPKNETKPEAKPEEKAKPVAAK